MFFWRATRHLRAAARVRVGTEVHSVFDYFSGLRGTGRSASTLLAEVPVLVLAEVPA